MRHGSNVPGPLEFRKRANRRRNTYLAHAASQPAIDPALLFANKPEKGWWGAHKTPDATATVNPPAEENALAWLYGNADASSQNVEVEIPETSRPLEAEDTANEAASSSEQNSPYVWLDGEKDEQQLFASQSREPTHIEQDPRNFVFDLSRCRNVMDLLRLQADHAQEGQFDEVQLRHIFEHTQQNWSWAERIRYLRHPQFHYSGCGHFITILEEDQNPNGRLEDPTTMPLRRKQIYNALSPAVRLGQISALEWMRIVDVLLERLDVRKDIPVVAHAVQMLAKSFEQCPDLDKASLGQEWLQICIDRLSELKFFAKSGSVLNARLCLHKLQTVETNVADLASLYVEIIHKFHAKDIQSGKFPALFLADLPRATLIQVVGRICALLHFHCEGDAIRKESLNWFTAPDHLKQMGITPTTMSLSDAQALKLGMSGASQKVDSKILGLFLWLQFRIFQLTVFRLPRSEVGEDAPWSLADVFPSQTARLEGPDPAAYERLRSGALAMPAGTDFQATLPRLLMFFNVSISQNANKSLLSTVQAHVAAFMHDGIYLEASNTASDRLQQTVNAVNLDMKTFQELIRTLVVSNKLNIRWVTRILERNRNFAVALAWSGPSRVSLGKLKRKIDPEQALETMEILAIAFAVSPAISAAQAFTKVKWCLEYLRSCGAVVNTPITRALWHAGVTRYGDQISREKLEWLVSWMRRVEGDEVTRKLLESSHFRRQTAAIMMRVARQDAAREDELADAITVTNRDARPTITRADLAALPPEVEQIVQSIEQAAIALRWAHHIEIWEGRERRGLTRQTEWAQQISGLRGTSDAPSGTAWTGLFPEPSQPSPPAMVSGQGFDHQCEHGDLDSGHVNSSPTDISSEPPTTETQATPDVPTEWTPSAHQSPSKPIAPAMMYDHSLGHQSRNLHSKRVESSHTYPCPDSPATDLPATDSPATDTQSMPVAPTECAPESSHTLPSSDSPITDTQGMPDAPTESTLESINTHTFSDSPTTDTSAVPDIARECTRPVHHSPSNIRSSATTITYYCPKISYRYYFPPSEVRPHTSEDKSRLNNLDLKDAEPSRTSSCAAVAPTDAQGTSDTSRHKPLVVHASPSHHRPSASVTKHLARNQSRAPASEPAPTVRRIAGTRLRRIFGTSGYPRRMAGTRRPALTIKRIASTSPAAKSPSPGPPKNKITTKNQRHRLPRASFSPMRTTLETKLKTVSVTRKSRAPNPEPKPKPLRIYRYLSEPEHQDAVPRKVLAPHDPNHPLLKLMEASERGRGSGGGGGRQARGQMDAKPAPAELATVERAALFVGGDYEAQKRAVVEEGGLWAWREEEEEDLGGDEGEGEEEGEEMQQPLVERSGSGNGVGGELQVFLFEQS